MKFLCVTCDEQMRLTETVPSDNNAVTAVFECPECGYRIAMLTNTMETQLVKSLDVKIGAAGQARQPMSVVRGSLEGASEPVETTSSGGKCPFTGAVNEAVAASGVRWTDSALARLERIPSFVRPMVKRGIEQHAKEHGLTEITEQVVSDSRTSFGM